MEVEAEAEVDMVWANSYLNETDTIYDYFYTIRVIAVLLKTTGINELGFSSPSCSEYREGSGVPGSRLYQGCIEHPLHLASADVHAPG